jgi:cytochrome c nitrite reductase small subunit
MTGLMVVSVLPLSLIWGGRMLEHHPAFCASCHEMQPSYDGWMASGAAKAHHDCIQCHSGEGLGGLLESEWRGLRMIGKHFFGRQQPDRPITAVLPEQFCLKCHVRDKLVASHAPFQTAGRTCSDCHKHLIGWKFSGQEQS